MILIFDRMSPKLGIFCYFSLFVSLISGAKYLIDIDDGEEIDRHGEASGRIYKNMSSNQDSINAITHVPPIMDVTMKPCFSL